MDTDRSAQGRLKAYYNIRRKCFSVLKNGRLHSHRQKLAFKDVVFLVSQAGRARVLREGHKNVHAFVCGTPIPISQLPKRVRQEPINVGYNPHQCHYFYEKFSRDNPRPRIDRADYVYLEANLGGTKVWV